MRIAMLSVVAALSSACGSNEENGAASGRPYEQAEQQKLTPDEDRSDQSSDIARRLAAGDKTVCADPEVQQVFFRTLLKQNGPEKWLSDYEEVLAHGGTVALDSESMSGRNEDISEVSCSATLNPDGVNHQVNYRIRPSADDPASFVVNWDIPPRIIGNRSASPVVAAYDLVTAEMSRLGLVGESEAPATHNLPETLRLPD